MERDKLQALLDEILDTPIGRLITRAEELMALNEQLRNGTALQNMQAQLNSALMECEQLRTRIESKPGACRMLSQGDACDCTLCKQDKEIARLQASWEQQVRFLNNEIERLQERIADYDSQFSQIAQALGGDARHAKGENKTMAAFVIETVEERTEAARWLYCHPTANLASDGTALVQLHPWLEEE
jgi:chaperonin cofactor prefoldin